MSHETPSIEDPKIIQTFAHIRPRLTAFARLHLRESADAEDVVQDTIESAWKKIDSFRGESRLETWIFGILRYKLLDFYRERSRIRLVEFDEKELPDISEHFDVSEHWSEGHQPKTWANPCQQLEHDSFWRVFDLCVFHLPDKTAQIFTLRELMGLQTQEICDTLHISEANCWTILHRARLKLRACLERSWFKEESK